MLLVYWCIGVLVYGVCVHWCIDVLVYWCNCCLVVLCMGCTSIYQYWFLSSISVVLLMNFAMTPTNSLGSLGLPACVLSLDPPKKQAHLIQAKAEFH